MNNNGNLNADAVMFSPRQELQWLVGKQITAVHLVMCNYISLLMTTIDY